MSRFIENKYHDALLRTEPEIPSGVYLLHFWKPLPANALLDQELPAIYHTGLTADRQHYVGVSKNVHFRVGRHSFGGSIATRWAKTCHIGFKLARVWRDQTFKEEQQLLKAINKVGPKPFCPVCDKYHDFGERNARVNT